LRQTGLLLRKGFANPVPFPAFHNMRPLFALIICSVPMQAQQPSLVLSVCNVGKPEMDRSWPRAGRRRYRLC
jgi:hypothetical protein